MNMPRYHRSLTDRDIATILAALRKWQAITSPEGGCDPRQTSPAHFQDREPLNGDEIDALCEHINLGTLP